VPLKSSAPIQLTVVAYETTQLAHSAATATRPTRKTLDIISTLDDFAEQPLKTPESSSGPLQVNGCNNEVLVFSRQKSS